MAQKPRTPAVTMNRRYFLKASGWSLAGGPVAAAWVARSQPDDRPLEQPASRWLADPVLVNPGPDRISILAAVDRHATGWVEFGETPALGRRADGAVGGLRPFHPRFLAFDLTGLEPGRRYHYRVQACPVTFHSAYKIERGSVVGTSVHSFVTLDPAAAGARVSCWNDTHENEETLRRLTARLRQDRPDLLVWNGDITNDIHREEQIVGQFLTPAGQSFAAETPLLLGRGNHDVRGRDARFLTHYVTGPEGRYYYGFRQGPLAGVMLDTGEDKPDDLPVYAGLNDFAGLREEQRGWLARVIGEPWFREAPFRVVFMHIPLVWETEVPAAWPGVWGAGIRGWICEDGHARWHDLLVQGRVSAVISGHTHRPAWFPPREGRPYAQLIGGGPQPERATVIQVEATQETLDLRLTDLDGTVLQSHTFRPMRT